MHATGRGGPTGAGGQGWVTVDPYRTGPGRSISIKGTEASQSHFPPSPRDTKSVRLEPAAQQSTAYLTHDTPQFCLGRQQ